MSSAMEWYCAGLDDSSSSDSDDIIEQLFGPDDSLLFDSALPEPASAVESVSRHESMSMRGFMTHRGFMTTISAGPCMAHSYLVM